MAWVLAVFAALALLVPSVAIYQKRAALLGELEQRLEILARGRAEVVNAWLEGLTQPIARVVDSEMFRLFATEIDLARDDLSDLATGARKSPKAGTDPASPPVPLEAQIPFMERVLTDFAKSAGFTAGYLINREGVAYVTSGGTPELSPEQRDIALQTMNDGALRFGPVRVSPAGLVLDLYAPVFPAQDQGTGERPVGVILLGAPVGTRLSEILAPPPLAEEGERLRLLQLVDGKAYEIAPGEVPALRPVDALRPAAPGQAIPFARRPLLSGEAAAYSVGVAVSGPPWWIVQEIDARVVARRLNTYIVFVVIAVALAVLSLAATFGAFWWRLANEHSAALADQYRRLAARIDAQKRLLDSINNTITDHIGLKSADGTYRYVNPAFAQAMNRDVESAIGLDDTAIFGKGTADRLRHSDQRALASGTAVTVNEEVFLGTRGRHLQITKIPYRGEDGDSGGIVSVTRDITELVEEQKKRERAIRQSVAALVRAVELRDPYLAGHSRRVACFAREVGQRLGASAEELATIEIAANLSQIGKLGVPRAILTKPERLSPKEIEQMRRHLDHAREVLGGIDFGLPVLETICSMHERLDGGGYPHGLAGAQISLAARILGACDVFCARVEPRSYRRGIAAETAIEVLEQNSGRYDSKVVAALREVAESITGEKLMADLGAA